VPNCVASLFQSPNGLGPRAKEVLGDHTKDSLAEILRALGGTVAQPARKEAFLTAVIERISDPELMAAVLGHADAPPHAAEILAAIRESDQPVSGGSLMRMGFRDITPAPWTHSRYSYGRPRPEDALEWLQRRGLVAAVSAGAYDYGTHFVVPAEAEVALRGGVIFQTWHPEPPRPEPVDAPPVPFMPDAVVAEVQALLDDWALRRPPALQKGGLGVRELRRSAKTLGIGERRAQFLYALAAELGLPASERDRDPNDEPPAWTGGAGRALAAFQWDGPGREVVVPSEEAATWGRLGPAEQWDGLFRAWPRARLWTDVDEGGLLTADGVRFGQDRRVRQAVAETLAALPSGSGAATRDVAWRLLWSRPSLFHCLECATLAVERAAEGLTFLGTGTADPPSLAEPGRTALRNPRWHAGRSAAAAMFHEPVATCVVQADLRVIVPGPPDRELAERLMAFADIKATAPARVYRLSDRSIARALDAGGTAEGILEFLRSRAPKGLPQNVEYLVADVARRQLREVTAGGEPFALRPFQEQSVETFWAAGGPSGGSGVVVLPCGAGKTVVGMGVMAKARTSTLILVTSIVAARQWRRELLDRTTLGEDGIGEYSGEAKQIRPVTLATYQVMTHRRRGRFPHLALFSDHDWGLGGPPPPRPGVPDDRGDPGQAAARAHRDARPRGPAGGRRVQPDRAQAVRRALAGPRVPGVDRARRVRRDPHRAAYGGAAGVRHGGAPGPVPGGGDDPGQAAGHPGARGAPPG